MSVPSNIVVKAALADFATGDTLAKQCVVLSRQLGENSAFLAFAIQVYKVLRGRQEETWDIWNAMILGFCVGYESALVEFGAKAPKQDVTDPH